MRKNICEKYLIKDDSLINNEFFFRNKLYSINWSDTG